MMSRDRKNNRLRRMLAAFMCASLVAGHTGFAVSANEEPDAVIEADVSDGASAKAREGSDGVSVPDVTEPIVITPSEAEEEADDAVCAEEDDGVSVEDSDYVQDGSSDTEEGYDLAQGGVEVGEEISEEASEAAYEEEDLHEEEASENGAASDAALPFEQSLAAGDAVFVISAEPGTVPEGTDLAVETLESEFYAGEAVNALNYEDAGEEYVIRHALYLLSGAEPGGILSVAVRNCGFAELREAFPDAESMEAHVLVWDEDAEAMLPVEAVFDMEADEASFELSALCVIDIMTVIQLPSETVSDEEDGDEEGAASEDGTAYEEDAAPEEDAAAGESAASEDEETVAEPEEDAEVSDEALSAEEEGETPDGEEGTAGGFHQTVRAGNMKITVTAAEGILPAGARLEAEEIRPVTQEKADIYGEALTSLSETLRENEETYSAASVYDIRIIGPDGGEIEPTGEVQVRMEYVRAQKMGGKTDAVDVAHMTDDGLELMAADVEQNAAGAVKAAEFSTEGFSYYIMFENHQGSESEPIHFGSYGWLKFATPASSSDWGHYQSEGELPGTNTEEGYHRILKVNLHTLNPGGNETAYDTDYSFLTDNQYFWTWENSVYISDFYVPGYEVVQTKMHTAWDDASQDKLQDSLVGTYSVRGYRSSDGTSSDLNVLDVYMKEIPTPETAMRYIVRYVHADGSVTDGNVRYLASGSTTINVDKARDGEVFSGISIAAGAEAVSANTSSKTVTFTYDPKVNLAKAYVYFEEDPEVNTTLTKGRYDKENGQYYNKEKGLYTDKSAEEVSDREFLVNLEAWYVDNGASVGMVLDASGSMAWTAGVPLPMELTESELNALNISNWKNSSVSSPLSIGDVNKLLDITECDNTNNGYNGYKYYVYTKTVNDSNPINEYAALGYVDNNSANNGTIRLGLNPNYKGTADTVNYSGPGWYFVNSGTDNAHYTQYGAKRYQGLDRTYGYYGASRFYIKKGDPSKPGHEALDPNKYYLYSTFTQGSNNPNVNNQESAVFVKRDQMMTKSETLQDSIAQFGAILNGTSPRSEMSMVRYSHTNFQSNLLLLNWTKESEKIAAAMDLTPNAAGGVQRADGTYQYGITGGTKARFGFNEYHSLLQQYADANNYKYLILFTDGKDQGTSDAEKTTKAWLNSTFPGYTIITMFMRSVGMADGDVTASQNFLQGLASTGKNGNPNEKLYFEAQSDDPHEVVEQFRQIAEYITTGLLNYSIRDYIDPRFDVVNEAGQILSVLDENGEFKSSTNPDVNAQGFRGFTTPDGKQAQLGYDSRRKMFYVLWQNQDIKASPIGSAGEDSTVTPWKSQIRLQTKGDFIGGNDVLTNGNDPGENLVYKPKTKTDSSGNIVPDYDSYGQEQVDTTKTRKSFPFASVNPGLLDVKLGNYEDTIFLGEEITPGDLLSTMMDSYTDTSPKAADRSDPGHRVADTVFNADVMNALGDTDMSSMWYVEYLERLGKKLHSNLNYYGTLLRHVKLKKAAGTDPDGVHELIAAAKADASYTVTESDGAVTIEGKTGTKAAGEKITIRKTGENIASVRLDLPYYYLESPTDPTTYAGPSTNGTDPQEDRVGTLTYTWTLKDLDENTPFDDTKPEADALVKFDTYLSRDAHMDTAEEKSVKYQFKISYEPLALTADAKAGDNGSERTRALTNQSAGTALIRNTVGTEREAAEGAQNTTDEMGWAVIHAVDGRILIEKRLLTEDFTRMKARFPDASLTLTLTGAGIALTAGEDGAYASADEAVWTKTLTLGSAESLRVEGDYTYIVSEWAAGLPVGTYTLTETVSDEFADPLIVSRDDIEFLDPDDPAEPYDGTVTKWKASHTGATWDIGKIGPSEMSYPMTDYMYGAAGTVNDSAKNVDPLLAEGGGKNYLNAQIGRAQVTNSRAVTSIGVSKTWEGIEPDGPIVVKLTGKLAGEADKEFYVELSADNGWAAVIDNLDIDGTVFTASEGTGTVDPDDGSCADFSAFDTEAAHFTFDGKTYRKIAEVYTDLVPDGTDARTDAVVANKKNKSGQVALTNQSVTKVKVEKHWEGITPGQPLSPGKPLVIKLHPSTGSDLYAELNPDNDWTHTFEDIPAAPGLVYTIAEGTGTVAEDGSCADFAALPASGTFTFDGKTYRQKAGSLFYTPAGAGAVSGTSGLDGSVSPDAGSAEITNEALTKVIVEKVWEEPADPGSDEIYVRLYKVSGSSETPVGDPVSLRRGAWSHTFENLKVEEGVTYTVKEGSLTGGTFAAFDGSFEINGQKMRQKSTAFFSDEAKRTEADKLDGGISPLGGVAVITNELVYGHVKLKKVDASATNITLMGAQFELYRDHIENTSAPEAVYSSGSDSEKVADKNGKTTYTTGLDGTVSLPDLAPGNYWLLETKAPIGYTLPSENVPALLSVDEDGKVTVSTGSSAGENLKPTVSAEPDDEGFYTVTVPNVRTYLLPAAGGWGLLSYLLIGALVGLIFLMLLVIMRRRGRAA